MKHTCAAACAVAAAAAIALLATAGHYGLTLDEPTYIAGARRVAQWFGDMFGGDGSAGFSDESLQSHWVFARPENYNLPVPVLVSAAGHALTGRFVSPLVAYRAGHCMLFGATLGILFACLARPPRPAMSPATDSNPPAPQNGGAPQWEYAAIGAGTLFLMPRVFAHGHLNATDVPTACFWSLAIAGWLRSESSWGWRLFTAVVCGLGLATKATFVLLFPLLAVWLVSFRRWTWWRAGLMIATVAPLVMLALCPMWWAAPLSRSYDYFKSVFTGGPIWQIEVYYLGRTYVAGVDPIPWHNALVLPIVTTPTWTLALSAIGIARWLRVRDAALGLWLFGAALLPAIRMLPGAPTHDGMRLLLPSLLCLGPITGAGFVALADRFGLNSPATRRTWLRWGLIVLVLAAGAASIVSLHPYEMSYYSELVGGLAGAERLGFEVSYWFDGYTPDVLRAVQERLPAGARVWTFPRYEGYPLLREWGLWRADLQDGDIGQADYVVLYARKSRFQAVPGMEQIYLHGRPIWSARCRGVQIVGVYRL